VTAVPGRSSLIVRLLRRLPFLFMIMSVLGAMLAPGRALAEPLPWLRDHLAVDAEAVAALRWAFTTGSHSGFSMFGGGGEINLGLEFGGGYAVLAGARVLSGAASNPDGLALQPTSYLNFLETTGQLGVQIELTDWVRAELGASVGQLSRCCVMGSAAYDSMVAGGYLRFGVDWWPREGLLLRAFSLWLRIDADGHPRDDSGTMPSATLALALGLGIRL
jgi:hypothetical protein